MAATPSALFHLISSPVFDIESKRNLLPESDHKLRPKYHILGNPRYVIAHPMHNTLPMAELERDAALARECVWRLSSALALSERTGGGVLPLRAVALARTHFAHATQRRGILFPFSKISHPSITRGSPWHTL